MSTNDTVIDSQNGVCAIGVTMRGICFPFLSWPLTIGAMTDIMPRLIFTSPGGGLNSKFSTSSIKSACISSKLSHAQWSIKTHARTKEQDSRETPPGVRTHASQSNNRSV